jgi:hypothetical protein
MTVMNSECRDQISGAITEIAFTDGSHIEESSIDLRTIDWWRQEDTGSFDIGVPDFTDRPALIRLVEASRALCALNQDHAVKLIEQALVDLKGRGFQ